MVASILSQACAHNLLNNEGIRIPLENQVKAWFGVDLIHLPMPSNLMASEDCTQQSTQTALLTSLASPLKSGGF